MEKLPLNNDVMNIILSLADTRSFINYTMTNKSNYNNYYKNNTIWMNQMLKLCPYLDRCCDTNTNYMKITKELLKGDTMENFEKLIDYDYAIDFEYCRTILFIFTINKNMINTTNIIKNYCTKNSIEFISSNRIFILEEIDYSLLLNENLTVIFILEHILKYGLGNKIFEEYSTNSSKVFSRLLVWSSYIKSPTTVKLILDILSKYPNLNSYYRNKLFYNNSSPFLMACETNQTEIVKLFIEYYNKCESIKIFSTIPEFYDCFEIICKKKFTEIVKLFMEFSIKQNMLIDFQTIYRTVEDMCISKTKQSTKILKLWCEYSIKFPKLFNFGEYIKNNWEITIYNHRHYCKVDTIKILLDYFSQNQDSDSFNKFGSRTLTMAILHGNYGVVKIVLNFLVKNQNCGTNFGINDAFDSANYSKYEYKNIFKEIINFCVRYPNICINNNILYKLFQRKNKDIGMIKICIDSFDKNNVIIPLNKKEEYFLEKSIDTDISIVERLLEYSEKHPEVLKANGTSSKASSVSETSEDNNYCDAIFYTIKKKKTEILKLFLSFSVKHPDIINMKLIGTNIFFEIIKTGIEEMINLILNFNSDNPETIDFGFDNYKCIKLAYKIGNNIVGLILNDIKEKCNLKKYKDANNKLLIIKEKEQKKNRKLEKWKKMRYIRFRKI
jgi:hypothetical protein